MRSRAALAPIVGSSLAAALALGGCSAAASAPPAGTATPANVPLATPSQIATPLASPSASASTPAPTPDLRRVPLPLTTLSGEVVDPAQATLSLDDALKIGRATPPDIIGTNPVARLMVISNSNSGSGYKPTLAWVIVTDDAPPFRGTGLPTTSSPPPYNCCLSWTIIAMDGRVLDHLQNRYFAPNTVPELPR